MSKPIDCVRRAQRILADTSASIIASISTRSASRRKSTSPSKPLLAIAPKDPCCRPSSFSLLRNCHLSDKDDNTVLSYTTLRDTGLEAINRKPSTSKPAPEHRIYPYLLKGVAVDRVNQVWAADITYLPMSRGFLYLVAVMDWHSRYVLAWRLSNTLEVGFCIAALKEALSKGQPEIFNTDQGSQFTGEAFCGLLLLRGIKVSMDGKGRYLDNIFVERLWRSVKYEEV